MNPLKLLWSFYGRIGRLAYFGGLWLNTAWAAAAVAAVVYIAHNLDPRPGEPLGVALGSFILAGIALFVWAKLALAAKRFHDLGKSGWLSLVIAIPVFGFIAFIFLLFARGDAFDNAYGPAQRQIAPLPQPG